MQKLSYAISIMIFAIPGLLSSCGGSNIPKTGKVKVQPHDDINRTGTYCKYEVTGAPSAGQAQLKVGEMFCILCPSGKNGCDNYSEVEIVDVATYPVKALTNGLSCTTCPKGTDAPAGYPFKE